MRSIAFLAAVVAIASSLTLSIPKPVYAAPEGISVQSIALTDAAGNGQLKRIKPGGQFMISLAVTNTAASLHEYVAIYEVRDENGYTVMVYTLEGMLGPEQQERIGALVALEKTGEYEARAFAYSRPAFGATRDSIAISSLVTSSISVMEISHDHQTGVIVPLFEYPFRDRPDSMWSALAEYKKEHPSVPFTVVINPLSGPGVWQNPSYVHGTTELRESGIEQVLGYISTDYARNTGGRTVTDIKAMIDRYREWYPAVNGIMFDEVNSGADQVGFYSEIVAHARNAGFEYVIANPGTRIAEPYIEMFDYLIIYENRVLPTVAQLQDNTYFPNHFPEKFAFVVKNVADLDIGYVDEIREYVGFLYMTDDIDRPDDPNPYNTLPPYFGDLVGFLDPGTE